jgi:hypothetical protein
MKFILGLLAAIGLGWVVLYYTGGVGAFDPAEQGRQAKAALRPGMSFDQACDLTGDPRKYQIINRKVRRFQGEEFVSLVPAPPVDCTRARIKERLAEGSLPYGFVCAFTYSADVAFTVKYDEAGAVASVEEVMTFSNWLNR